MLPLDRPFRTTFLYQSTMFTRSGSGRRLGGEVHLGRPRSQRLLVKLEMTEAGLTTPEAEKAADQAMPHRLGTDDRPEVITWYPQETPDPAGSINASARDLTKWLTFQLAEGRYKGERLVAAAAACVRRTRANRPAARCSEQSRDESCRGATAWPGASRITAAR